MDANLAWSWSLKDRACEFRRACTLVPFLLSPHPSCRAQSATFINLTTSTTFHPTDISLLNVGINGFNPPGNACTNSIACKKQPLMSDTHRFGGRAGGRAGDGSSVGREDDKEKSERPHSTSGQPSDATTDSGFHSENGEASSCDGREDKYEMSNRFHPTSGRPNYMTVGSGSTSESAAQLAAILEDSGYGSSYHEGAASARMWDTTLAEDRPMPVFSEGHVTCKSGHV